MIRIMKYGEIPESEIFARVEPTFNVGQTVSDIIKNVRFFKENQPVSKTDTIVIIHGLKYNQHP